MWEHDEPAIEFVILVEHAEVIHGKLYMMGGGQVVLGGEAEPSPVVEIGAHLLTAYRLLIQQGRQDSNPRLSVLETDALTS